MYAPRSEFSKSPDMCWGLYWGGCGRVTWRCGLSSLPASGGSNPSRLTTWLLVLVLFFNVGLKTNHHSVTREANMKHKSINALVISKGESNEFSLGAEMSSRGLVVPAPS